MPGAGPVFRKRAIEHGEISLMAESHQALAILRIPRIGHGMALILDTVSYAMQFGGVSDGSGGDARLADPDAAIGHFADSDSEGRAIETRERRHHGPHQGGGAVWTDERQGRSGPALVFAEDHSIKEEGNKIGEVVGMEMGKQNMGDAVAIDPGLYQIGECARSEIQQECLIGLKKVSGGRACGVNIGS